MLGINFLMPFLEDYAVIDAVAPHVRVVDELMTGAEQLLSEGL